MWLLSNHEPSNLPSRLIDESVTRVSLSARTTLALSSVPSSAYPTKLDEAREDEAVVTPSAPSIATLLPIHRVYSPMMLPAHPRVGDNRSQQVGMPGNAERVDVGLR